MWAKPTMLRVRGACLAFFQICVVVEVVVGLMADDSPLQSRSGAEPWFGAKLSFGLRLAGFARLAPVLQRIAVPKRLLVLQHGLAIHTEMTVRAMALPRQGTRTDR